MEEVLRRLEEFLALGQAVALATIASTRGSTPREAGAKLLYHPSGEIVGTVGGGCGEGEVLRAAADVIDLGVARLLSVDLLEEAGAAAEKACGGAMEVLVDPWTPSPELLQIVRAVRGGLKEGSAAALVSVVEHGTHPLSAGGKLAVLPNGEAFGNISGGPLRSAAIAAALECFGNPRAVAKLVTLSPAGTRLLIDPLVPRPRLLIVGAGHVAHSLAQFATLLDFHITVVDDRPSFANAVRFAQADAIIVGDYSTAVQRFCSESPDGFVVIVTRGHQHDYAALRTVLAGPADYVGMIGSRSRVRATFRSLEEEGLTPEQIARVHAPIGIDIGAQTAAEIALSIAAELVKSRRAGHFPSLSDTVPEHRARVGKDSPGGP